MALDKTVALLHVLQKWQKSVCKMTGISSGKNFMIYIKGRLETQNKVQVMQDSNIALGQNVSNSI